MGRKPGPKCGAKCKQSPGKCQNAAGFRTDHHGQGKCFLHGGASPIKHGIYSSIQRYKLADRINELKTDPELLTLLSEVALLKALTEDLVTRWEDIFGPEGALMTWWMNGREQKKRPPPNMPDFLTIGVMVEKVVHAVDVIQKHQQGKSITIATLNRVLEQFGVEVVAAVQEAKLDAAQSTRVLEIIERRWGAIKLDAYSTSSPRA